MNVRGEFLGSRFRFSTLHKHNRREMQKKVIITERSRVCHNHKPQQPSTPRGREKGQKHTCAKQTNVREAQRPAPSSTSEVIRMLKQTANRGQRVRENFETLSAPWYKPQSYTELRKRLNNPQETIYEMNSYFAKGR